MDIGHDPHYLGILNLGHRTLIIIHYVNLLALPFSRAHNTHNYLVYISRNHDTVGRAPSVIHSTLLHCHWATIRHSVPS